MVRFRKEWRGYERKQVEEYIHKNTEFSESKIRELENCVERLKAENDYLYAKNNEYRRNEERVSGAIIKAMEVKSALETEWRAKLRAEEDRLMIFKEKWTAYARGIDKSNADRVVEDIDGYIREFRESFIKMANRDINVRSAENTDPATRSYYSEQQRLRALKEDSDNKKMSAASLLDDREGSDTLTSSPVFRED